MSTSSVQALWSTFTGVFSSMTSTNLFAGQSSYPTNLYDSTPPSMRTTHSDPFETPRRVYGYILDDDVMEEPGREYAAKPEFTAISYHLDNIGVDYLLDSVSDGGLFAPVKIDPEGRVRGCIYVVDDSDTPATQRMNGSAERIASLKSVVKKRYRLDQEVDDPQWYEVSC